MAKMRKRTGAVYNTLSTKDGIVEFYVDRRGEYRWRVVHANGRILTHSSESYKDKRDAQQGYTATKAIIQKAK